MIKKLFLLCSLSVFIFLASGCVSICAEKVYVEGNSPQCVKKIAKPGTEKEPNIVKKADNWVKENLW